VRGKRYRLNSPVAVVMLVVAVATVGAPGSRAAPPAFAPCSDTPQFGCATMQVPLDRDHPHGHIVTLHLRRLVPPGRSRGTLFLVAGGPGQSALSFLGGYGPYVAALPGWTLVAADARGVGLSDPLSCRSWPPRTPWSAATSGARCAAEVGPTRRFYSTQANVEDLERIRVALGVKRIGLFGVSYGTKVVMRYALTYPKHVDRLILDSVVTGGPNDALYVSLLRAMPHVLDVICTPRCPGVADAGRDFLRLMARLNSSPTRGPVTRRALVAKAFALDVDWFVRSMLPAAVHAALHGDPALLARIAGSRTATPLVPTTAATGIVTTCEDGGPWPRRASPAVRLRAWQRAAKRSSAAVPGPLRWMMTRSIRGCLRWPYSPDPDRGAGPLPDVPVLALAGGFDVRTPATNALAVAGRFPRGRVIVVPGAGHGVLGTSACAARATALFLGDQAPPRRCPAVVAPTRPAPVPPRSFASVHVIRGFPARVGRTVAAVRSTLDDASRFATLTLSPGVTGFDGLRSGRLASRGGEIVLTRYSYVPGVWLTGRLVRDPRTARLDGRLIVGGAAAAHGVLVARRMLRGKLDGVAIAGVTR
jgi:pimeloyl-ACP methyl ester carboxylesterase